MPLRRTVVRVALLASACVLVFEAACAVRAALPFGDSSFRVESTLAQIRPGRFAIPVTLVLGSDLQAPITARPRLRFLAGTAPRDSDFVAREVEPFSAAVFSTATTVSFEVDVSPLAATADPITVVGELVDDANQVVLAGTPLIWTFSPTNDLVVSTTAGAGATSLRGRIDQANATPGIDRILFDPVVFATGGTIVIDAPLPILLGTALLAARPSARVHLVPAASITSSAVFGLDLQGPAITVQGIALDEWATAYGNNVGNAGAIRIRGDDVVLVDDLVADSPGTAIRNDSFQSVRIESGRRNRLVRVEFRDVAGTPMLLRGIAPVIADCLFHDVHRLGINVQIDDGEPVHLSGTVFDRVSVYGVLVLNGSLDVDHVLFLGGNGYAAGFNGGNALELRSDDATRIRNSAFTGFGGAAAHVTGSNGTLSILHSIADQPSVCVGMYCTAVSASDGATALGPLLLVDSRGSSAADFTPRTGSPMIDAGLDLHDRNDSALGRYSGAAADTGAEESGL